MTKTFIKKLTHRKPYGMGRERKREKIMNDSISKEKCLLKICNRMKPTSRGTEMKWFISFQNQNLVT